LIDIKEINDEIKKLENEELNYVNLQKLSWLYIVRDHSGGAIRGVGGNEFLDTCEGCERDKFFDIMSEHFEAMKILHPKEYRAVLERLSR
jgi:hypothetical protein